MDTISKARRSWNMSRIRSKNTRPELLVRSLLHLGGYRFRLHARDLPGHPDIVLPKWKTIVFVNGCFWHRHKGCVYAYTPKSNKVFWQKKFLANVQRDATKARALASLGWMVEIVWECEVTHPEKLRKRLVVIKSRAAKHVLSVR
ncbi:MAG: DNA mismatch endonuclease Vsr [Acidipila sp.]|nr:DNA mismatch endonuclease Vsr [Acidipila sp.]